MTETIISSFLVSAPVDVKPEFKDRFLRNGKVLWSKMLCRNPEAFPFLKRYLKKWLPVHLKYVSAYCQDLEFLRKHESRLDYVELSSNPHAMPILERHLDKICWEVLSSNPSAVSLLKRHSEKVNWGEASSCLSEEMMVWISDRNYEGVDWFELSFNPTAVNILKKFPEKVDHFAINFNTGAEQLLKENPEWVDYRLLSANQSEWAMRMVSSRIQEASFDNLSANPFAIDILLAHPDRIDWVMAKENPEVGRLYQVYPDKVDLVNTVMYESMLSLIGENHISSVALALNPGIFCVDQVEMKSRKKAIQSLISKFM